VVGELRTARGTQSWLARPTVREHLDEFRRRYWSAAEEQEYYLRLVATFSFHDSP
jgi:hypothetical protein